MDEKNLYLESLKHRNYDMYKYFKRGLDMIATLKERPMRHILLVALSVISF